MSLPKTHNDIEIDYDTDSPRFSAANLDEIRKGIEHLSEHGYAVFSDVLSEEETERAIDMFWKHLQQNLEVPSPIRRNDPKTWNFRWPGSSFVGLMNDEGIGQSDFIWSVRGKPNIKKVFSQIWDSNELFISFDGAGCFRDWRLNENWKTQRGWYHCDQNPVRKPDRCSIQGLVSLTDSDETTGGLVVVPGSHKHFLDLQELVATKKSFVDYVRVPADHPIFDRISPRLIKCKAGDLVVWDSRCIHCNTVGIEREGKVPDTTKTSGLLRLVCYICMSPASLFRPEPDEYETIDEYRQLREKYVRDRISCSHWPLELIDADRACHQRTAALKLNEYQRSLIIGTNVDPAEGQGEVIY